MAISVRCPHCQQTFQLRDELAGRTVRCKCGRPVAVPDASTNTTLTNLLEDELSRPYQPLPQRDAPDCPPTKYKPIGHSSMPPPSPAAGPPRGSAPAPPPRYVPQPQHDDDDDDYGGGYDFSGVGLIIFLLVFVVGNIILYMTTGWIIIPIRFRR